MIIKTLNLEENPRFKRNVVSKNIFVSKDFSTKILNQRTSFIKISGKEYEILKEKDPLKSIP